MLGDRAEVRGLRSPILVIKAVTLNHSSASRLAESLRWIAGAAGHPAVSLRHWRRGTRA